MALRLLSNAKLGGIAKQAVRPFASVASPSTRITTLENGLTVASEHNPNSEAATVGVWIEAGSRADPAGKSGAAYFLEHVAFKGSKSRSEQEILSLVGGKGAKLSARATREHSIYTGSALGQDVPAVVELLAEAVQQPALDQQTIEKERAAVLRLQDESATRLDEVAFENAHSVAFQGYALANPITGTYEGVKSLTAEDLSAYIKQNHTADRMVLVGAGNVEHERLVDLARKHFGSLSAGSRAKQSQTLFTGSEVRVRNDLLPVAHIVLGLEGPSWTSPDFLPMQVIQHVVGSWTKTLGSAGNVSARIAHTAQPNHLAESFSAFHLPYSDTGLFGVHLATTARENIDDLVYFTTKELVRLATSLTEADVYRAKNQLRASIGSALAESTELVAADIGTQVSVTGERLTPQQIADKISQLTLKDIRRVAEKYIWDQELAVAGVGPVEAMPDYSRVRACMTSSKF
ncbi:uncharacterized protein VTP21DRAFT_1194 [Calcarisporiella thermophila]|uniref:uncharacterized protein n=1 Tax=Calcarisporiella thermophila TaxID=911321 RepID=UPI0037421C19